MGRNRMWEAGEGDDVVRFAFLPEGSVIEIDPDFLSEIDKKGDWLRILFVE